MLAVLKDGEMSHTLMPGAFFGEVALLFKRVRRSATVRALTIADLMVLSSSEMDEVRTLPHRSPEATE